MISSLRGTVSYKNGPTIVAEIGGVGYKVRVTSETSSSISPNQEIFLYTYLAVREDALELYGFLNREELSFFELLIGVPGIGPKSAIGILSIASPSTLSAAIQKGDASYLTKVSGIGKKSAEKIVLELRDKIGAPSYEGVGLEQESDVLDALQGLGYSLRQAREALQSLPKNVVEPKARVREALKLLGKK